MNKLQLILLMIASVVIIAAALQLMSQPAYANYGTCKCQAWLKCSCDGIWAHGIPYPCDGRIYCPTWPHWACNRGDGVIVYADQWCRE